MISYTFKNSLETNNSKEFTPVYSVKYCDTPFTVKSSGISLKRYTYDDVTNVPDFTGFTNITPVDTLITNIVGFYSDDGAMLGFHQIDNFALHYTGYFHTDHPTSLGRQQYYFATYGFGYLKMTLQEIGFSSYLDVISAIDDSQNVTFAALIDDNVSKYTNRSLYLEANTWYKFDVYYYTTLGEAGFSLLWTNKYYGLNNYIPLSAGVCSLTPSFRSSDTLPDVISVERSEEQGNVSSLTFKVPLVTSGSSSDGYYYNSYWNKYCHSTSPVGFNKFKMIEFQAGYRPATYPTDADDLITKFIGHIESIRTIREKTDEHIEVNCVGFENFYKQALNLNYPNIYDYWNAGYIGKTVGDTNPDGKSCPTTYDGWELCEVFKSLSLRAGIDPYLFLKKYKYYNYSNIITSGTWLIEETSPKNVILDTALNYGNSSVVFTDIELSADDEYIVKSNFGDTLFDYANTITDVYGWQWGCNPYYDGAPYLKSNNNPYSVLTVTSQGVTSGGYGWTKKIDLNAVGGVYYETNDSTQTEYIAFPFAGSKINLSIVTSNDSGYEFNIITYTDDLTSVTVDNTVSLVAGNIVIVETVAGEESNTIASVSMGHTMNFTTALTNIPKKGGYVRIATFSAEVRRGTEWTTAIHVQTTYHSCYFKNGYDRLIASVGAKDFSKVIEDKRYYYDGIDPKTSVNPCSITIAENLPYDNYILTVTRLTTAQCGTVNYMRINALLIFDKNVNAITKTYYTGDSVKEGTVSTLNVLDSGEELRNDTIVVGRMLGAEVPGDDAGKILNPNNPTYEYILCRAVDSASIYDPDTVNYVGMPRQTIQVAPEIASYDRAKYWATTFINRYRNPGKQPEFQIIGDPLLEIGDCIAVYDEGKGSVETFNKFWITGIEDSYERGKYLSNVTTTTYEPWESYSPKISPSITDFSDDNSLVINVSIGTLSGWTGTLENGIYYFNPYENDLNGNKIVITYDLVVDAYVRVDIIAEKTGAIVSTLLNPTGSNGPTGWMKQDSGKNYVATWDGVDLYGDWNTYITTDSTGLRETIGKGYYVCENKDTEDNNQYHYGKFKIRFSLLRKQSAAQKIVWIPDFIYTKREHAAFFDVICNPKNILYDWKYAEGLVPQSNYRPCYTDSVHYDQNTPMTANISIRDLAGIAPSDFGLIAPYSSWSDTGTITNFLTKTKIQLTITLTPYTLLVGEYDAPSPLGGKAVSVVFKQHSKNADSSEPYKIHEDGSFKYYDNFTKYFNMSLFNFGYTDYEKYANEDWVNLVKEENGSIYLGIYLLIEIIARDKSGRRCFVRTPSSGINLDITNLGGKAKTPTMRYSDTFWLMWIDDIYPYPITNGRNYKWGMINTSSIKNPNCTSVQVLNRAGVDILSLKNGNDIQQLPVTTPSLLYNRLVENSYIPVVRVYSPNSNNLPLDSGNMPWGYGY